MKSRGKELHTPDQLSNQPALRLNAPAARLHAKASQTHACGQRINNVTPCTKQTHADRAPSRQITVRYICGICVANSPSDMLMMARKAAKATTEIRLIFQKDS